jgi:membrane-associated phospholipid phosphatase
VSTTESGSPAATGAPERLRSWPHPGRPTLLVVAGALAALVGTTMLARTGVPGWERSVFEAVNGLPDGIEWALWVPMQFGAILAVPAMALLALGLWRRWSPALGLLSAGLAGWILAKVVKSFVDRPRPARLLDGVQLRGGEIGGGTAQGLGFTSGHAAIAFGLATILVAFLPRRWRWLPLLCAVVTCFARVYYGAHLPLDVVGGAAMGVALGAAVVWCVGPHRGWR